MNGEKETENETINCNKKYFGCNQISKQAAANE